MEAEAAGVQLYTGALCSWGRGLGAGSTPWELLKEPPCWPLAQT